MITVETTMVTEMTTNGDHYRDDRANDDYDRYDDDRDD